MSRTAEYVYRLLKHMGQHGCAQCIPRVNNSDLTPGPAIDFTSGYVLRAHTLPRQVSKTPWRLHENDAKDLSMLRFGHLDDGTMEFKATPGGRNAVAGIAHHS